MSEVSLFEKIVISAIPILFAITLHEVAHGWVASRLGDQTAKMLGRLSLNPLKHVDPIGTVLVPLLLVLSPAGFLFGWAKPVPVDWRNLKRPRQDMAWVAIAGPAANLCMLAIWLLLAKLTLPFLAATAAWPLAVLNMAIVGVTINIVLILFNLIPLPPLDGSRVVSSFLSPAAAYQYNQLERYGLFIILLLLATGVLNRYFTPLVIQAQRLAFSLIGVA